MVELLIILGVLATICLMVGASAAFLAWQGERHQSRRLAEQLLVEGHIERLTTQTLQAMRQAARDRLRADR